jgi:DNA mismatch repair ATPase MutS
VSNGHVVPYGTFSNVDPEVRQAYYYYGYRNDEDMPELPCMPPELSPESCPEETIFQKQLVDIVDEALKTLNPRLAKVLRMRYGINTGVDHTLDEVGYAFRVTRERIRQLEAKAVRLLQHPSRNLGPMAFPEYCYKPTHLQKNDLQSIHKRWLEARAEQFAADQKHVMEFIDQLVKESNAR